MSAMSPREMFVLDLACKPLEEAFGGIFHVGTSADGRQPYRDVDVRAILFDDQYDALRAAIGLDAIAFLSVAVGQYLHSLTGMPIDFQFQRQTEANERHNGLRNPLGVRGLDSFAGDASPERGDREA